MPRKKCNRNALRFSQVDAALDTGARRRVADWMEKSKLDFGTQFITTTHRKEMMEKADKIVGVKHANTVSFFFYRRRSRHWFCHLKLEPISGQVWT